MDSEEDMQFKFEAVKEIGLTVGWIKDYFAKQPNARGAVIGLSGGKDSALCAALLVEALGTDNVLGLSLPNGDQKDIMDARAVAEFLGIEYKVVNINPAYSKLHEQIVMANRAPISNQACINVLPRLRMTVLYAFAADRHFRVCGTGNASEDMVGYATKWGDLACDFDPIQYFTTEEIVEMGDVLNLPREVMHKPPSDGICGLTDEDNLGIKYAEINKVLRWREDEVSPEVYKKIMEKKAYNKHKISPVPVYKPEFLNGRKDYLAE
jgi:NAD+ synthase